MWWRKQISLEPLHRHLEVLLQTLLSLQVANDITCGGGNRIASKPAYVSGCFATNYVEPKPIEKASGMKRYLFHGHARAPQRQTTIERLHNAASTYKNISTDQSLVEETHFRIPSNQTKLPQPSLAYPAPINRATTMQLRE